MKKFIKSKQSTMKNIKEEVRKTLFGVLIEVPFDVSTLSSLDFFKSFFLLSLKI
jgi:hypothetical protein